jgi:ubiquinone/menaquinone biosynthesis C-methylase UbiE
MIRIARERSGRYPNIEFLVADALTWPMPTGEFDCITSIATLHHLPLREMLTRMASGLKAGGALVVLDLYCQTGPGDALASLVALPVDAALRLLKTGRLRSSPEVREAWAEHGKSDSYLSLTQIRRTATPLLAGARIRRHLLWRYSLVWTKPPDLA